MVGLVPAVHDEHDAVVVLEGVNVVVDAAGHHFAGDMRAKQGGLLFQNVCQLLRRADVSGGVVFEAVAVVADTGAQALHGDFHAAFGQRIAHAHGALVAENGGVAHVGARRVVVPQGLKCWHDGNPSTKIYCLMPEGYAGFHGLVNGANEA